MVEQQPDDPDLDAAPQSVAFGWLTHRVLRELRYARDLYHLLRRRTMRSIVVSMHTTANGHIEGLNGEMEWVGRYADEPLPDQQESLHYRIVEGDGSDGGDDG